MKINYDMASGAYARLRRADPRILDRLIHVGRVGRGSRVLEVGSGSGNYITAIGELTGCECRGLEQSGRMLAKAKKRSGVVTWSRGDARVLPYPGEAFDFVFCVDVIHHVPKPGRLLDQAFRVLRASGCLSIVTDSEWPIRNRDPLALYFRETVEDELKRYPPD